MGTQIKRLVFDTNIVISALIFKSDSAYFLRSMWANGYLIPLISKETTSELIRVLTYPKFKLPPLEQESLRDEYLHHAEVCLSIKSTQQNHPCRDPSDQKFIDLALSTAATALVSGDQDILIMRDAFPIPIFELNDLKNLLQIHPDR